MNLASPWIRPGLAVTVLVLFQSEAVLGGCRKEPHEQITRETIATTTPPSGDSRTKTPTVAPSSKPQKPYQGSPESKLICQQPDESPPQRTVLLSSCKLSEGEVVPRQQSETTLSVSYAFVCSSPQTDPKLRFALRDDAKADKPLSPLLFGQSGTIRLKSYGPVSLVDLDAPLTLRTPLFAPCTLVMTKVERSQN